MPGADVLVRVRAISTTILAGALTLVGCRVSDVSNPIEPDRAKLDSASAYVVGLAAADLTRSGQFNLGNPRRTVVAEIDAPRAEAIARAWIDEFGPIAQKRIDREHGADVSMARLRTCGRTMYAESPYEDPDASLPAPVRRIFGPWWLVSMCASDGTSVVSMAVSAYDTDVEVVNDSLRFRSLVRGEEVIAQGIPIVGTGLMPVSPERAVQLAVERTHRRVSAVPELVAATRFEGPPQWAGWVLRLESDVTLRGRRSDRWSTVTRVYVGFNRAAAPPDVLIPVGEQPLGDSIHYVSSQASKAAPPQFSTARVTFRTDIASVFEPVANTEP